MSRQRKLDEDLWEDSEEELSSDHVVERFYSQRVRHARDDGPKGHPAGRPKRRPPAETEADE